MLCGGGEDHFGLFRNGTIGLLKVGRFFLSSRLVGGPLGLPLAGPVLVGPPVLPPCRLVPIPRTVVLFLKGPVLVLVVAIGEGSIVLWESGLVLVWPCSPAAKVPLLIVAILLIALVMVARLGESKYLLAGGPLARLELRARLLELKARLLELEARLLDLRARLLDLGARLLDLGARLLELRARLLELRARLLELMARLVLRAGLVLARC